MIAAWMVVSTVVALLLVAGAAVAARVSSLFRGVPLRWFWMAAIVGTVGVSALWMAPQPTSVATVATTGAMTHAVASPAPLSAFMFHLPSIAPSTERALMVAWAATSGMLALVLLFALVRLGWEGRGWADGEVGDTPVKVSNSLGPAAVGVLHPRVVIPRWVLTLDASAQRAIVAHEQEHRRRRDPALLMAGLVALVLMPWNIGLWLGWRGLRLAVELDCDERVLRRGIDRAGYANILLGAWGQTRESWLPSAALTRASGLGSRVQHLMRPEPRRRGMKTLIGTMAAVLLVVAACETPGPQRIAGPTEPQASREVAAAGQSTSPMIIIDGVVQKADASTTQVAQGAHSKVPASLAKLSPDSIASIEIIKGNTATAKYGAGAVNGVIIVTTKGAAKKN